MLTEYDHVHLVILAGAEALSLRRQLIEHAHKGERMRPTGLVRRTSCMLSSGVVVKPRRVIFVAGRQGLVPRSWKAVEKPARKVPSTFGGTCVCQPPQGSPMERLEENDTAEGGKGGRRGQKWLPP